MSVTHCTNPWAAGFNPNNGSHDHWDEHEAEAHEVTYQGMVLALGEHNYYDDSDFYAVVWDETEGCVKEVACGTTRGWSYHDGAHVDASDEVKAKARKWEADRLYAGMVERAREAAAEQAAEVRKGDRVRSLTTRGKNVGVEGKVMWIGDDDYSRTGGKRYGVKVDGEDKLRYLSSERVELVGGAREVKELTTEDLEELRWRAENRVRF